MVLIYIYKNMSDRLGLFAYVSFFLNKVVKVGNGYTRTEELKKTSTMLPS